MSKIARPHAGTAVLHGAAAMTATALRAQIGPFGITKLRSSLVNYRYTESEGGVRGMALLTVRLLSATLA
jgi:hypothetical protein